MNTETCSDSTGSVCVRNDLRPGDIGYIVYLHGILYAEEHRFDHTFEPYVAGPLSKFALSASARERIWIVEKNGKIKGSVAVVEHTKTQAQLRWLLLHPELRGMGLGKKLIDEVIRFAGSMNYRLIFLWTVGELEAAKSLYTSMGFQLTESKSHQIWGRVLTEERYELKIPGTRVEI